MTSEIAKSLYTEILSSEAEHKLTVTPPTTTRELLGRNIEEDPINLASAPLIIGSVKRDASTTEYFAIIDIPFTSHHSFFPFLKAASPVPDNIGTQEQHLQAVIDDWTMPDFREPRDKNLYKVHSQLGASWFEFEKHRELFLEVLYAEGSVPPWIPSGQLMTYGDVVNDFPIHGVKLDDSELMRMIEIGTAVTEPFRAFMHARDIGNLTDLNKHNRAKLLREFYRQSDRNIQKQLTDTYADLAFNSFETGDENQQRTFYGRRVQNGREEAFDAERNVITLKYPTYSIEAEPRISPRLGKVDYRLDQSTFRPLSIVPLLHWTSSVKTDSGEVTRNWEMSFEESPDLENAVHPLAKNHSMAGEEDYMRRFNPLVGMLALPYFSAELRERWPKYVGLPGVRRKQAMGPAQVPVLALIRQRELLDEEFIAHAENHVDSFAA